MLLRRRPIASVGFALLLIMTACGSLLDDGGPGGPVPTTPAPTATQTPTASSTPAPTPTPTPTPSQVFVGAGDIAGCDTGGDELTAALLDEIPGTVFTLGDNVYETGTRAEFTECYEPTWGRHKERTRPTIGNHEYTVSDVAGDYFDYFGAAAGEPGKGWYSFDLGNWHVVVLNSQCWQVPGGCDAGSPQDLWLRADLTANTRPCVLAMFHHPRFSSAAHGNDASVAPFWQALHEHGAEIVLNGHEHDYERFAPQTPAGVADPSGIRQFVVGTGGRSHDPVATLHPNSEVFDGETFGVLKLVLRHDGYDWEFVPEPGATFRDSGSADCH